MSGFSFFSEIPSLVAGHLKTRKSPNRSRFVEAKNQNAMNETPMIPTQNSSTNAETATHAVANLARPKNSALSSAASENAISEMATSTADIDEIATGEAATSQMRPTSVTSSTRSPSEASSSASSASENAPVNATANRALPSVEELKREERVAELVRNARVSLRRGKGGEARQEIAQALALDATQKDALELMGDVFVEEGEHEKAILVFRKGHALYPQHAAFEEKIAIALIDIEEMKLSQLMRKMALEGQMPADENADLRPGRAALLSLLVPGAGQFYLEQNERGAAYLGATFLTLCGWALPLKSAMTSAGEAVRSSGSIFAGWSGAIAAMTGGTRTVFWLSFSVFSALYIVSALDAVLHISRLKAERKRALGL